MSRQAAAVAAIHGETPTVRACASCERPLPPTSRPERRYCSTRCRQRAWDVANPAPGPDPAEWWRTSGVYIGVRMHWHVDRGRIAVGDGIHPAVGYWYGPEPCPAECPAVRFGPNPTMTGSAPAIRGEEWRPPELPTDANGRARR